MPRRPCLFTLEERRVTHAAELFEALRNPEIYEFLDENPPASVREVEERLLRSESRLSPDGREHWLNWVVRTEAGAIAGCVQATVEESKYTNVAYVFSPQHQGRGIASAAVGEMLRMVASRHEVDTFFIVADAGNFRSIRLAERLGFMLAPSEIAARRQGGANDVVFWKRGVLR